MDDDLASLIIGILGAGGGTTVLVTIVNGIFKYVTGSTEGERRKNTDLLTARENAEAERDEQAKKRRESEEYISLLRRQLHEAGVIPKERSDD